MECTSVCCEYVLLPLVKKEANLTNTRQNRAIQEIQAKIKEKEGGVREMPTAREAGYEVISHGPCGKI